MSSPSRMRRAWDRFAAEDPMYFIHCGRKDWDRESFFASGREEVADWLGWMTEEPRRGRMVEVGCGLGRMTVAFAREFERVDGVDISPSMVKQARDLEPPANVEFHALDGSGRLPFDDATFAFAASNAVFQHVPDEETVATYLREIARTLAPGGLALLHFDTVPPGPLRLLSYRLPDGVLPRTSRRGMRCHGRAPERVRELAAAAGFEVVAERDPGSANHLFLLAAR